MAQISSVSHLNMLQIQENSISGLIRDAAQWGHIAMHYALKWGVYSDILVKQNTKYEVNSEDIFNISWDFFECLSRSKELRQFTI